MSKCRRAFGENLERTRWMIFPVEPNHCICFGRPNRLTTSPISFSTRTFRQRAAADIRAKSPGVPPRLDPIHQLSSPSGAPASV